MRRFWTLVTVLGLALLLGAGGLAGYNLWTEQRAGRERDRILQALVPMVPTFGTEDTASPASPGTGTQTEANVPQTSGTTAAPAIAEQDQAAEPLPLVSYEGHDYIGLLSIEALNLELPVLSRWSYANLDVAPAVYHGAVETHDLVICAHNYSTHFGALGNLQEGDRIVLQAMDGRVFRYVVSATEVVSPLATADVIAGQWDLTLFTCTVGGRARIVIRCDPQ